MRYEKAGRVENQSMAVIKSVVFGLVAGAIVSIVCLLAFALFCSASKTIPQKLIQPFILVACALGSFIGGYVTVRLTRAQGMLYGMLSGLLLFGMISMVSVMAIQEAFTMLAVIKGILMVLMGAIGGIMGVNKRAKRK